MKIIELKPIFNNKYVSIPIGLLLVYAGVYSAIHTNTFNFTNIQYVVIGSLSIILSFEKQIFGVLRYVKYDDNKLIYKRTPISKKQQINSDEINEIKFYGSKIYINSDNDSVIINIDLIKMKSRLELRDFFVEEFKDKVVFTEQANIFIERYERKLKRIEEKQKLKNGK